MGNDVTYDDVSGLYWYNNRRSAGLTTYFEAKEFYEETVRTIQVGEKIITLDNFNMATKEQFLSLMANDFFDIDNTFIETNQEPNEVFYWGRYDNIVSSDEWGPSHSLGGFFRSDHMICSGPTDNDCLISSNFYALDRSILYEHRSYGFLPASAWGVATFSNPVPEPTAMLLFCAGLVSLVGARMRRKKKSPPFRSIKAESEMAMPLLL